MPRKAAAQYKPGILNAEAQKIAASEFGNDMLVSRTICRDFNVALLTTNSHRPGCDRQSSRHCDIVPKCDISGSYSCACTHYVQCIRRECLITNLPCIDVFGLITAQLNKPVCIPSFK